MNPDILNTVYFVIVFLLLFAIAEFLYHVMDIQAELTRKVVHFGTGLLSLMFPIILDSHWYVLFLCSSFAGLLILSMRFKLLKSINAIERESVGAVAYPVSVYVCYLAFANFDRQYIYFYLPILMLAICDPLAALAGKKWPWKPYKVGAGTKTWMGSSIFFVSAMILSLAISRFSTFELGIFGVLLVSSVATIAEAVSRRGYDNLMIPMAVLGMLVVIDYV